MLVKGLVMTLILGLTDASEKGNTTLSWTTCNVVDKVYFVLLKLYKSRLADLYA